ncbi:CDP-diacylglycerol--glycerol-3-phosphate 3-phosphatidyltransferase [Aquicella lusitana]|uniref:CDP-diacylglycerol--glycerol-3-phosphate 3-phosphatidyltransferase n=2 Tax=Aquicella lusitana TaxID=254246 RepID=A0A370GQS3_9COXI|nr:CDP-diacylglycerol--glycerol-3-phosphate 3-phosphatidyltransferase [Aquicella lusitana]VVC73338.1 CDP-diacylglycerol--glycerol-3-phosphate 3-phosphatidyltransferase [Aquicella lusitana]
MQHYMTRPYDQMFNWPNLLTLLRILVIPLLVIFFYLPVWWGHLAAAIIFAAASITDWLDGYLARYLKQSTRLGAFLDPVADKLMVSIALVLIVAEQTFQFVSVPSAVITIPAAVITIPAAVIVAREIIVSALREWMAEIGQRARVAVSGLGKIKTAVQMLALVILLLCDNTTNAVLVFTGYVLLYVAAVLTIWSMLIYLKAAWSQLTAE